MIYQNRLPAGRLRQTGRVLSEVRPVLPQRTMGDETVHQLMMCGAENSNGNDTPGEMVR
jgi:hypothetical protein